MNTSFALAETIRIEKKRDEWQVIHALANKAEPKIRAAILRAIKDLKGSVNMSAVRRALTEGDTAGAYALIPWDKLDEMKAPVTAELRALLEASYIAAIRYLPKEASALRFDVTNQRAVDWLRENSARLVVEVGEGTKQAIRDIIDRAFNEGIPPVKAARMLKNIIGLTSKQAAALDNYLEMLIGEGRPTDQIDRMTARYANRQLNYRTRNIARTETINASGAGQQLLWEDALASGELQDERMRKFWIITKDSRLCIRCAKIPGMNPNGVRIQEYFQTPLGPKLHPTAHPSCFPADQRVISPSPIQAVTKRWFDGDLIIIRTASGKNLSCTPNHPILTDRGWIAASLLNKGSNVISSRLGKWNLVGHNDDDYVPSKIEDIAEAFRRAPGVPRVSKVPISAPYFHGDGFGGEVEIIGATGQLRHSVDAAISEHGSKDVFHRRYIGIEYSKPLSDGGPLPFLQARMSPAGSRDMRSRDLMRSLLARHLAPFYLLCLALRTRRNAMFEQNSPDYRAAGVKLLTELQFRDPRSVFEDKIIDIKIRSFSAHVYNLQTESGYFITEGIITHNCRCSFGTRVVKS